MVKPLNIAVVCDSIDYTLGGSAVSAKRFVNALKSNHNILLVTNAIKHPHSNLFKGLKVYKIKNSKHFNSNNYIFGKVNHLTLVEVFKKHNIDLIYSVYPTTYSGNAASKAGKILKIPVIGHFHVQAENINILFSKLGLDLIFYKLFASFYKKCNLIFCPSTFAKNLLLSSGVKTKKFVLSNGVDLEKFKKVKSSFNVFKKYNIPHNSFIFLYLGRLEKEKDIFTLVRSAKNIKNHSKNPFVLLAGNGSLKFKLKDYCQKNKIDNVVFTGFIKNNEIVSLYNSANCFVSPSLIELEGMTVLEAMACGLPLVLSNSKRSASKDFVKDNGYLFRAKDSNDLSKKLIKILDLPDSQLKIMSKNSLDLIVNYSFTNSVKKMQEVFYSFFK